MEQHNRYPIQVHRRAAAVADKLIGEDVSGLQNYIGCCDQTGTWFRMILLLTIINVRWIVGGISTFLTTKFVNYEIINCDHLSNHTVRVATAGSPSSPISFYFSNFQGRSLLKMANLRKDFQIEVANVRHTYEFFSLNTALPKNRKCCDEGLQSNIKQTKEVNSVWRSLTTKNFVFYVI